MTSLMLVIGVHHRAFYGLGPVEYAIGISALSAVLIMVTIALKKQESKRLESIKGEYDEATLKNLTLVMDELPDSIVIADSVNI